MDFKSRFIFTALKASTRRTIGMNEAERHEKYSNKTELEYAKLVGKEKEMEHILQAINHGIEGIESFTNWEYGPDGFTYDFNYRYSPELHDIVSDRCVVKTFREEYLEAKNDNKWSKRFGDIKELKYLYFGIKALNTPKKSEEVKQKEEEFKANVSELLKPIKELQKKEFRIITEAEKYIKNNNLEEFNHNQNKEKVFSLFGGIKDNATTAFKLKLQGDKLMKTYGNLGLMYLIKLLNQLADCSSVETVYQDLMRDNMKKHEFLSVKADFIKWAAIYSLKGEKLLAIFKSHYGEDILGDSILKISETEEETTPLLEDKQIQKK